MHRQYKKWHSPALGRDMELLVFGHGGAPMIVFPSSMGRFYDYEDRGLVAAIGHKYESGELQTFCVDSVDSESWYNKAVHPKDRALRHALYDAYILNEVLPFIQKTNGAPRVTVSGCSFGGYHSANFAFRHPELCDGLVSLGGAFDIHQFLNGYYDDNCYFHCPPDFLPGLSDAGTLRAIRRMRIVLATGETDICLAENHRLSHILNEKQIPHFLDVWGEGTGHDWHWWERMTVKFFG
ncbi:MAG: esterase [Acidobacteria bacterium]|nr:esterase [Acidobacteriota bacterium]